MKISLMRHCTCGCDEFEVGYAEQGYCSVCIDEDGNIDIFDREAYDSDFIGNLTCRSCGKEYAAIDDIPIFSPKENRVCQI